MTRKLSGKFDIGLMVVTVGLALFGVLMVYSASSYSASVNYGNEFFYMYKQIFGDRKVTFDYVASVELRGMVNFDLSRTYSKSSMSSKKMGTIMGDLWQNEPAFFRSDYYVITYKEYIAAVQKAESERDAGIICHYEEGMYLFNVEGKDALNGKNVLVLGKPSPSSTAVISQMICSGYKLTSTARKEHRLRRHGYEFTFSGLEDPVLNNALLAKIDSETIQCIGRARLIWNDCRVLVAGLPVENY